MTADNATANNAAIRTMTCGIHTSASYASMADSTLINDAWGLMNSAKALLDALSPDSTGYYDLVNAYNSLGGLLSGSPSSDTLYAAMVELTRAMASAQY